MKTISNDIYWNQYYKNKLAPKLPSPFADWVMNEYGGKVHSVIDIGCGNGRDVFHFHQNDKKVIGVDASITAINYLRDSGLLGVCSSADEVNFHELFKLKKVDGPILFYSRFFLHAINKNISDKLLKNIYLSMSSEDYCALEFRTNKDPLFNQGEVISESERCTDHYRRFIDFNEFLLESRKLGFDVVFSDERSGYAKFKDEDPVVARFILKK